MPCSVLCHISQQVQKAKKSDAHGIPVEYKYVLLNNNTILTCYMCAKKLTLHILCTAKNVFPNVSFIIPRLYAPDI